MKLGQYWLSCKDASRLVSQSLDRPITLRERLALSFHLLICRFCRRFGRQLAQIRIAIHRVSRQIEQDASIGLAPEAKQRIQAALASGKVSRGEE